MAKIDTILCIGAAHWDIIGRVSADREDPGGDYPGTVVRRPGGVALNSAVALCAAGLSVSLCAAIGRDDAGRSLVKRLTASDIGCDGLLRPDGSTDSYIAIETSAGSLLGAVADCRLLEACGVALAQRAIDLIRTHAPGRLVVDGNLPETAMRDLMAGTEEPVSILAASPAKAHRLSRLRARHRVSLLSSRK